MLPCVKVENNPQYGLVVSSRVLASEMGKRHDHVIRDLDKIRHNPNVGDAIISSFYTTNNQKRKYKEYLLTKDGFTLYMFNVQGYNDFKWAYIQKFNEMENTINKYELTPQYELKRKTYLGIPVMTSKDVAYLLGKSEKNIQYLSENLNGKPVEVLTDESLRQFKVENNIMNYTTWHLSIYYAPEVLSIVKAHQPNNRELEECVKDYFKVEHAPTYLTIEEKKLALEQARYLVQCGNHLKASDIRELAFKFATAILINIGSWHEGKAGFNGITSNWDINSLEGWNKICLF